MQQENPALHIFAGPNGSGKSSVIKEIVSSTSLGYYLNADDFEKILSEKKYINLGDYFLTAEQSLLDEFLRNSSLYTKALQDGYQVGLSIRNNVVVSASDPVNSYEAALLIDFIRNLLFNKKASFSFESVMSHSSKKEIFETAAQNNYDCYLYYVTTESPIINIARVKDRVAKGGHHVDEEKIISRYHNSLALLHQLIPFTKRTVLYDNSSTTYRMFAIIEDGIFVSFYDQQPLPRWYQKYVAGKIELLDMDNSG
jgi:predicted ABC-type ATPase